MRVPGIAYPVPAGIAGFGMITFALSCVNAGFFASLTATRLPLVRAGLGVATSCLLPTARYVGDTCGVTAW